MDQRVHAMILSFLVHLLDYIDVMGILILRIFFSNVMLLELWMRFLRSNLFPLSMNSQISLPSFPQGASPLFTFGSLTALQTLLDKKGIPQGRFFSSSWISPIQGVVLALPLGNIQVVWLTLIVRVCILCSLFYFVQVFLSFSLFYFVSL